MRKIIASEFLSLDGVMEAPGPAHDFKHAGWTMPFRNETVAAFKREELFSGDAMLLGRKTYEGFAAAWPNVKDEQGFADRMNGLPKHVVTSTLKDFTWNNSHAMPRDLAEGVRALKQQPGGNILMYGSGKLANALMQMGLVDELRFLVFPVVLGCGQRFFDEAPHVTLQTIESRNMDRGVTLLRYAVQS
jgi:dihydrofolate reductase